MAAKPQMHRKKQGSYLAAYFVVLFFSVVGLSFQGGVWMLTGLACWACFIFGSVYYYDKSVRASSVAKKPS